MHLKTYCIAMTGGGSGGHVYPGLAVLEQLQQILINRDIVVKVLWIGNKNGIEKDIIESYRAELSMNPSSKLKLSFCGISCGKLRRYFSWQNFSDMFRIALGVVQSFLLLRRERPQLLFSKGGFVSVPPIIGAKLLGIESLAHESDLDPGLATKIALPLVQKLYLPYEYSQKFFAKKYEGKLELSGNPVRAEFFCPNPAYNLLPADWYAEGSATGENEKKLRRPLILVLGGSLGAREINDYVRELLDLNQRDYYILHQCGSADYEQLHQLDFPHYKVFSFISSGLGYLYQICRESGGLVFSRAGAGTLWEILASCNKAILLPLQGGSRGDQLRNAQFFVEQGWAECFLPEAAHKEAVHKEAVHKEAVHKEAVHKEAVHKEAEYCQAGQEKEQVKRNVTNLLAQIRVILQDRQSQKFSQEECDGPRMPNAAKIIADAIWEKLCVEE